VRALLLALGAVPLLLVTIYYLFALSIDPVAGAWYLLLLVTGHAVAPGTAFVGCVLLGTLCAAAELVYRQPAPPPEEEPSPEGPSVYGPGAYAGPGSLGGTESALRR
jgi:hypothetical protein